MTSNTSDAFLQGQGIPVDPHQIDSELIKLWGPAAQRIGGPEVENPTVTRVVLANLVVGSKLADAQRVDETIDTVVERYPCRAIVLRQTDDTAREVKAEVSALCHLPAPGMPQVCSERILLRAGPKGVDLLPGAVRSLLEADLPFVLWWTYDPREVKDIFLDLGDECSRLILDLPDPGAEVGALQLGLNSPQIPYARDICWFGISRWRELVAQFFDGSCREALGRLTSVEVRAQSPQVDQPPRVGAWLIAWLAGQLGWKPQTRKAGAGTLEATFAGPSGTITTSIKTEQGNVPFARLTGVSLLVGGDDGHSSFRLQRPTPDSEQVRVEVDFPTSCTLPRVLHAPTFDTARRVAAALESSRVDPPYRKALPHMLWLLDGK